jgi:hypothetical protein
MVKDNNISYVLRQRCMTGFCVKLGQNCEEILEMLQHAYRAKAMSQVNNVSMGEAF